MTTLMPPRQGTRSDRARKAMIDAAEKIIAERGMAALTLKDVQIAAKQSNKSAAQYHFGSKEGLIEALAESRLGPVNEQRGLMLDALEHQGHPPTARQAIEAMVRPLAVATLGRSNSRYGRFLAQVVFDPALAQITRRQLSADSFNRVRGLLRTFVDLPTDEQAWRRVADTIRFALVTIAAREGRKRSPEELSTTVDELIETCTAILTAPGGPPARRAVLPVEHEGVSA